MLDLGDICYKNEQHKKRYEQYPQNFEMNLLTFDQDGKLKKAKIEKTGRLFSIFELEILAEELGVQLSEDWQSGPFMKFE